MIQRGSKASFMPNVYVFPGGLAEPSDSSLEQTALRETFEETGLLLDEKQEIFTSQNLSQKRSRIYQDPGSFNSLCSELGISPPKLKPWSRWVTPSILPRTYDNTFFLVSISEQAMLRSINVLDKDEQGEVSKVLWKDVHEMLDEQSKGLFHLEVPQLYILQELRDHGLETVRELRPFHPQVIRKTAQEIITIFPGDSEYEPNAPACKSPPQLHESLHSLYSGVHRARKMVQKKNPQIHSQNQNHSQSPENNAQNQSHSRVEILRGPIARL